MKRGRGANFFPFLKESDPKEDDKTMPATVTIVKRTKFLGSDAVIADIQLDNSYVTGGEAVTAQMFGLDTFEFVLPSPAGGYLFEFDHVNKKIKAFTPTTAHTHTENTAATYAQNASTTANTAVAASEVANAVNLSAVKVRVLAIGF